MKIRSLLLLSLLFSQYLVAVIFIININASGLADFFKISLLQMRDYTDLLTIVSNLALLLTPLIVVASIIHAAALARKPIGNRQERLHQVAPSRLLALVKLLMIPIHVIYLMAIFGLSVFGGLSAIFGFLMLPLIAPMTGLVVLLVCFFGSLVFVAPAFYATCELLTLKRCRSLKLSSSVALIILQFIPFVDAISYAVVSLPRRYRSEL